MTTNANPLAKLQRMAKRWGGEVVVETTRRFDPMHPYLILDRVDVSTAPFDSYYAINWHERRVLIDPVVAGRVSIPSVIHEMGHVFASRRSPNNLRCDETSWLGWEYLIAKRVGCIMADWHGWHDGYGLGSLYDGYDYGALSKREQQEAITYAIAAGKHHGNITADGRPRAVR